MIAPPDKPTSTTLADFPRRPGPLPAILDESRRAAFLDLLASGKGVDQAVGLLRVSYRAYLNTRRVDPVFAEEADSCRRVPDQMLDYHALEQVLRWDGQSSVKLLLEIWRRRDRAYYLNLAREDRARERAEDRRERLRRDRVERRIRFWAERDELVRSLDAEVVSLRAEIDRLRGGEGLTGLPTAPGPLGADDRALVAGIRLLELPALSGDDVNALAGTDLPRVGEEDLARYHNLSGALAGGRAS